MNSAEAAAAAAGFAASYGQAPDVVWSAPGRVNLIGEHTDYNDGLVLPFAIAERAFAAAARRDDDEIAAASAEFPGPARAQLADIGPGTVAGWAAYPLGVAWALARHHSSERPFPLGISLHLHSQVPAGAGLSSSAALEVAVATALNDLWDLGLTAPDLARAGRRAENEVVGAPTGIMDQYASLLGQADAAVFLDCRTEQARSVPLPLRRAGLEIVLIDTLERHSHSSGEGAGEDGVGQNSAGEDGAGGYAARRASCERAARQLGVPALRDLGVDDLPRMAAVLDEEDFRRARHVITENDRVAMTVRALEDGDLATAGQFLTSSHASMRDDFEISTPPLDLAVEVALGCGALGARMTGGGFGGAAIALIEAERAAGLASAAREAFRAAGFRQPAVRTVMPSKGPRKER